jgi:tRNA (uracil-5-)-methyltransferase
MAAAAAIAPSAPAHFTPALTDIEEDKYETQLQAKIQRISSQFAEFSPPELEPFRSKPKHYRMR